MCATSKGLFIFIDPLWLVENNLNVSVSELAVATALHCGWNII